MRSEVASSPLLHSNSSLVEQRRRFDTNITLSALSIGTHSSSTRGYNKNKTTPIYFNFAAEPEPTLFNLAAKGHTLPPPPEDGGSDIESEPDTDPDANDIDSAVTQMWRQFSLTLPTKHLSRVVQPARRTSDYLHRRGSRSRRLLQEQHTL